MHMRKTTKKWQILAVFLALIAAFSLVHAAAEIHFTDHECNEGDEVTVSISLSEPISAGQITLSFDNNLLEYVSLTSSGIDSTANVSGNSIMIVSISMDSDLHTVSYSLTLRAKAAGSAKISVSDAAEIIRIILNQQ